MTSAPNAALSPDSQGNTYPRFLLEYQALFDNASVGILYSAERKIRRHNPRFAEMFGFTGSAAIDMPGSCIFRSDDEYAALGRLAGPLLSRGQSVKQELYMRRQDGSDFWVNLIGYVADPSDPTRGTWWIFDDRSEVKRAEESLMTSYAALREAHLNLEATQAQLLQSEKLASVGLLAAGVAHEVNNPIGFVNSNLATLKNYVTGLLAVIAAYEEAERDLNGAEALFAKVGALKQVLDYTYVKSDAAALVDESLDGLERVKKIVQSLMDFSQSDSDAPWRPGDLHLAIEGALRLVSNDIMHKCEVIREFGAVPPVECLAADLTQVLVHVLTNAADAVVDAGIVTVRTGSVDDRAWIEIADNGKGIAPEHLAHIFDPFFTTKPVGKGTGLGLSVAYRIVQKHHGRFEVTSQVGSGTRVRIVLPLRQPAAT